MNSEIYMNPLAMTKEELENYCVSLRVDLCNWIKDDHCLTSHEGIGEITTRLVELRLALDWLRIMNDKD